MTVRATVTVVMMWRVNHRDSVCDGHLSHARVKAVLIRLKDTTD